MDGWGGWVGRLGLAGFCLGDMKGSRVIYLSVIDMGSGLPRGMHTYNKNINNNIRK